jgi:hypothetical protein
MSTIEALSGLAGMFLGAGAFKGTRVLAETSVAEMMRPQARVYRTPTSSTGSPCGEGTTKASGACPMVVGSARLGPLLSCSQTSG